MPPSRRPSLPVTLAAGLLAALLLAVPGVAAGQTATTVGEESSAGVAFPLPVVAPILVPAGTPAPLAVTSFGVQDAAADGAGDEADAAAPGTVEIRFAEPFDLPTAFRYRIDLRIGQPGETGASETRISFVVDDGAEPEGVVEIGNGSGWDAQGEVDVTFEPGEVTIGLPADLAPEPDDLAWLDTSLVESEGDAADRFITPLVPADQVLTPTGPAISAAQWAWGSIDQQPPAAALDLGPAPLLSLEGDEVVVQYQESIPVVADGRAVVKVVDVVRIAPDFADGGAAPYLVVIDHERGAVSLLDGTLAMPAEVPNDGAWLVTGLPERDIGSLDEVRFSLPAVLDVFGIEATDLATDDQVGVGIARSAQVASGVQDSFSVRSDGVVATTSWLTAAATAPVTPSSQPAGANADDAAGESDDGGDNIIVFVAIGCLVALLGTAAFLVVRWLEHRRRVMASGPVVVSTPAPEPSEAELEELAEFTRQLFDNRR
jgi:hypothetical protein